MPLEFDHKTLAQRVLFGTGKAIDHCIAAIEGLGAERVLLIADAFTMELSDEIAGRVPVVARIHDIVQHVPAENAAAAVAVAHEHRVDAVLTIGGGSSTGLAKIVARETGLPIVAVPTTFAGSEATDVWGMTEAARKTTGVDPKVLPKVIVYDAALTAGLPAKLAMASGTNALAHAVDGFWAPRVDPINSALGAESLRALIPGMRALAKDADDIVAREQTLYGSYLAAVAFASAGGALHHKICHALGGTYNMPHAETHAVVIPYVAAFNAPHAPAAAERITAALDGQQPGRGLWELGRELGNPPSLEALGFREADIPEAASIILPAVPASNPRPVTQDDLEVLLRAAWAGTPAG